MGLAIILARNPKASDTFTQLQDTFLEQTLERSGFYFHKSMGKENDSHQDCGCALARLIGHQQQSFQNFESLISFWSMTPNYELTEDVEIKKKEAFKNKQERLY